MLRKFIISLAIAVASAGALGTADAHPVVKAVSPSGIVARAPTEIRLTFSESLIPRFSGVQVADQRGRTVATGTAIQNTANKRQLVVPLRVRLAPGIYRVKWHAVSTDTHRVNGSFTFRVRA